MAKVLWEPLWSRDAIDPRDIHDYKNVLYYHRHKSGAVFDLNACDAEDGSCVLLSSGSDGAVRACCPTVVGRKGHKAAARLITVIELCRIDAISYCGGTAARSQTTNTSNSDSKAGSSRKSSQTKTAKTSKVVKGKKVSSSRAASSTEKEIDDADDVDTTANLPTIMFERDDLVTLQNTEINAISDQCTGRAMQSLATIPIKECHAQPRRQRSAAPPSSVESSPYTGAGSEGQLVACGGAAGLLRVSSVNFIGRMFPSYK